MSYSSGLGIEISSIQYKCVVMQAILRTSMPYNECTEYYETKHKNID